MNFGTMYINRINFKKIVWPPNETFTLFNGVNGFD